jgi:hypothetical protein
LDARSRDAESALAVEAVHLTDLELVVGHRGLLSITEISVYHGARYVSATASKASCWRTAAKARCVKLGEPKLALARKVALETIGAAADAYAGNVLSIYRPDHRCHYLTRWSWVKVAT